MQNQERERYSFKDVTELTGVISYPHIKRMFERYDIPYTTETRTTEKGGKRNKYYISPKDMEDFKEKFKKEQSSKSSKISFPSLVKQLGCTIDTLEYAIRILDIKPQLIDGIRYFTKEECLLIIDDINTRKKIQSLNKNDGLKELEIKQSDYPYADLASAVVVEAEKDYVDQIRCNNIKGMKESENWFKSEYFQILTMGCIDPDAVIKRARELANDRNRKRIKR